MLPGPVSCAPVRLLLAVMLLCLLAAGHAQEIEVGAKLDSLPVGTTTYQDVQVRSINIRTAMITHRGGMTSIKLRDLSPEWQARFRYSPLAEAAADEAARNTPPSPPVPVVRRPKSTAPKGQSKLDALLLKFGQPAAVQAEVDLRPRFFELELGVKNQGYRPSCAVFAIVSALEFQNAELTGQVQKFSEEYLIWAVRKSTRRLPPPGSLATDQSDDEYRDEGFALDEVVAALRAYGIPLQASMPNTFGRRIDAIEEPAPVIVQEARSHQRVSIQPLPGRDRPTLINNLVHALNAGMPVPVGMSWPATRVVKGYISTHKGAPNLGHAVTIVGYKSPTGRIEDAYFIFKNSWGPRWGQGGYGTVTYGYLSNYLGQAILLELQSPAATPRS
jgi:hypothetical protein